MTLGIILVLVLANPLTAHSPTIPSGNEFYLISGNSLKAKTSVQSVKFETLGVKFEEIDPGRYISLIKCLIRWESGGNSNAIGKAGEIGILQFMPTTFLKYSQLYGLDLDIHNPKDQIYLATKMLEDDFNNLRHWTTAQKCQP